MEWSKYFQRFLNILRFDYFVVFFSIGPKSDIIDLFAAILKRWSLV